MTSSGRGAVSSETGALRTPRQPIVQLLVLGVVVFGVVLGLVLWIHAISTNTAQSDTARNGTAHSSGAAINAMNGMAGMSGRAPVYTATVVGGARVDVSVQPAKVGHNTIAMAMVLNLNRTAVQRFTAARQLSVTATLPQKHIGPLSLRVRQTGPGRYVTTGAVLSSPGLWTLQISYRTSGSRLSQGFVRVPING